jgi:hypothetical protein
MVTPSSTLKNLCVISGRRAAPDLESRTMQETLHLDSGFAPLKSATADLSTTLPMSGKPDSGGAPRNDVP